MNLDNDIRDKIINETKADFADCKDVCFDFQIKYTPYDLGYLFMRYIRADATNPDKVKQSYRWLCFNRKGQRLDCDPVFASLADEAKYKSSMETLYQTKYLPQ